MGYTVVFYSFLFLVRMDFTVFTAAVSFRIYLTVDYLIFLLEFLLDINTLDASLAEFMLVLIFKSAY